jgi:murein L,D-transpeptidase YcbB/YkuD
MVTITHILILIVFLAGPRTVGSVNASAPGPGQAVSPGVAPAIRTLIDGERHSWLEVFAPAERKQLTALYAPSCYSPMWVDTEGRPNPDARAAVLLLKNAGADGLSPADYDADMLERWAARLDAARDTVPNVAAFDVLLSLNTLRFFRQLHSGRVDPRTIGFRMTVPADDHDFPARLRAARSRHRIAAAAADLSPPLALYRRLRGMLARYRSLAADPALTWSPAFGGVLHPGERHFELLALHRRLLALGDVLADAPAPAEGSPYEGVLVDGVKRFQVRHGLQPDGVIGHATQTALRVSLSWRVRQIELALERLRWLPHLGEQRFLAVNIPMFRLWAWDELSATGAPSFGTGVIVGRALNTQTPVFVDEMRDVIFRPYWNVPRSILRHEILPAMARDPEYLQQHDMEIVSGESDAAASVAVTADNIARLRDGRLRVRQRPGPKNSLGLVKFVFPNDSNVYLHGTPAPELFSRARRDFSHGCVRVEDPVALAEWTLKGQPEWTRERILAAMNGSTSRRVPLTQPITVILFYITAVVMPEDESIHFADDIYGHDARLDRALAAGGLSP